VETPEDDVEVDWWFMITRMQYIKEQLTMRAQTDFKLLNSDDLPLDISEHCTESIKTYDKNGGCIGKQ